MTLTQIQEDIAQGEGLHSEFKEAGSQLPRNLFETVCSFLNTDGGTILLGVDAHVVEMTQPDSPKSPTQKYRLTAKGKQLLESGK